MPESRRRLRRERAPAALDSGEGRDSRAAASTWRSRRARSDLRVHRAGRVDAELHGARDDREHDRGARGDGRRLPVRRRDEGAGSTSRSARRTSRRSRPEARKTTSTRSSTSTSRRWNRSWPSRPVPATSSRSTELVGTELAQVCVGSSVNSSYEDMAVVGATLRGQQISEKLVSATATPGSRQILDQITQSGTYVDLLSAGVRMLEPACGPCVGMGQAPPSGANSLRTFNRNFPGRSGTADDSVYLCSPAVAAVSMLTGVISDPREFDAPEVPARPAARPAVVQAHILAPAPSDEAGLDRDPARAEHQATARAEGASGHARAAGPDRRAR